MNSPLPPYDFQARRTELITTLVDETLLKMKAPTHKDQQWLRDSFSRAFAARRPFVQTKKWIVDAAQGIDPDQGDKPLWTWPLPNF